MPGPPPDLADAQRRLAAFRRRETAERIFAVTTGHPSEPTGFCWCEGSSWRIAAVYLRGATMRTAFALPWSRPKAWLLRRLGARVGRNVYFSHGVWIDPAFPELVTIEDNVFFGMGAKVFAHEFRIDEFRAGKVTIRRGAFIGGLAVIGCGVEIGEGAVVAACSVADRDVPAGATLISAPSRILRRPEARGEDRR